MQLSGEAILQPLGDSGFNKEEQESSLSSVQVQRKGAGIQHPVSNRRQAGSLNSSLNRADCQPPSCFWRCDTPLAGIEREQRHAPLAKSDRRSVLSLSRRCTRQVGSTNPSAGRAGFGLINERAHLPCALVLQCCRS
jgi:hypothetical protein